MLIPEILRGEVHLPMTEQTLAKEAIALANGFYQTDLRVEDFKESQAFRSVAGVLTLELVSEETGEVVVTFVNKSAAVAPTTTLWNPLERVTEYHSWMAPPIQLLDADEIAFLDELSNGNTYPITTDNTLAWKLSQLLNEYGVLGQWVSGTMGPLATGGFRLVYKGWSMEAPDGYLVDYSPMLAIIEILHGEQQGYLCLRS